MDNILPGEAVNGLVEMLIAAGLLLFYVVMFIIAILIAVWVYRDAKKRYPPGSSTPVVWLIVALLFGILGLIIYLIVRPKEVYKESEQGQG